MCFILRGSAESIVRRQWNFFPNEPQKAALNAGENFHIKFNDFSRVV